MTPRELRATLDCLDLSAAEAGHLLGVHRATVYRWLDGSTSVPIVVELLLRLMVRRGIRPTEVTASRHGRTSAKPRSGRSL
jgi:predicted transcriptional regulator